MKFDKPEGPLRETLDRYLPFNERRMKRFLDDWEGFVLACLRRMRVPDEEDVLYRVFDRAVSALPGFRGQSKLSTWLYRIAWREGLRHLEKQGRLNKMETLLEDATTPPDRTENAEQVLERLETSRRVQVALAQLGPMDREVLALRYLEELKLTEIAERMEIPLGTAKVRAHRALLRLKKILEEKDDE